MLYVMVSFIVHKVYIGYYLTSGHKIWVISNRVRIN